MVFYITPNAPIAKTHNFWRPVIYDGVFIDVVSVRPTKQHRTKNSSVVRPPPTFLLAPHIIGVATPRRWVFIYKNEQYHAHRVPNDALLVKHHKKWRICCFVCVVVVVGDVNLAIILYWKAVRRGLYRYVKIIILRPYCKTNCFAFLLVILS